ncbi:MAG TPA: TRAFs-binding domain-containing protein [Allosphingosinicella sp.]
MVTPRSLASIIALARAGGLERAWELFNRAPAETSDAAAMAVLGRLLKDRARQTPDLAQRSALYREAASAYAKAAQAQPSSYALINAATLFFLGGDPDSGTSGARRVLALLDENADEGETQYYRHATRSEALLLLGQTAEAKQALSNALAIAPYAWEDQASTLRQFSLILEARGEDSFWLDAHRPPSSVHFAGHMSFRADGRTADLRGEIDTLLQRERVGFGFGALAAGADIIVAEALIDHGAELHAVLPGGTAAFAAVSVDPFGAEWRRRFDAVLGRATEVRSVRPIGFAPNLETIALADEVAMGAAVMNARRLESRPVQLLVVAEDASRRARDAWAEAGWHQHILTAPREEPKPAPEVPAIRAGRRRLAVLAAAPDAGEASPGNGLPELAQAIASLTPPAVAPYLSGTDATFAYDTPAEAALAAAALRQAVPGVRIGGHYGAAESYRDPFSGGERIGGDAAAAAAGALASTLPGTVYVTEDFAAALTASGSHAPRTEFIGELEAHDGGAPVGLFVLKS